MPAAAEDQPAVEQVSTRWRAWEFWPTWAAYAPLVPWLVWLSMRHGPGTIAAANPGFPDGGTVGESKHDILAALPREWTLPWARIDEGPLADRARALAAFLDVAGVSFPVVLKPDVGQRGAGVRKVRSLDEAMAYLREAAYPVVAQVWHPGPFEAGIFYCRHPEETRGRISSITDKIFPSVVGDGVRSLAALVQAHPRLARQWPVFRRRHASALSEVLDAGATFSLGEVGNHCQGTLFRDGRTLWTPALEARIDAIARQTPGFFIGRFDVRYETRAGFMAGEDLAIVELNGVTSEPTDVYDPERTLWSSYRALFAQWTMVFAIGAANRRAGHSGITISRLVQLALSHLRDRRRFPASS